MLFLKCHATFLTFYCSSFTNIPPWIIPWLKKMYLSAPFLWFQMFARDCFKLSWLAPLQTCAVISCVGSHCFAKQFSSFMITYFPQRLLFQILSLFHEIIFRHFFSTSSLSFASASAVFDSLGFKSIWNLGQSVPDALFFSSHTVPILAQCFSHQLGKDSFQYLPQYLL